MVVCYRFVNKGLFHHTGDFRCEIIGLRLDALALGETHETAIGILEIVLGIDCVRHGIHPSGHANSS